MAHDTHDIPGLPMTSELKLALELAKLAGATMLQYFDGDQQTETKGDDTPVTIADKMINSMVIKTIGEQFPDDGVVGEEESTTTYGMGRKWICDPIDGTSAQVMGLPTAMFSLGFVVDGKSMVGVAYEPHRQQLYVAVRGHGSYCNGKKLQVSQDTMETAIIGLAPDFVRPGDINQPFMKRLLAYDKHLALFDGAVFRSCLVASGRIAGFPHPRVNPYDIAAVHLIVEEAGGKVTGIDGQPLDYSKDFQGAIISNGTVHSDLLALFNER